MKCLTGRSILHVRACIHIRAQVSILITKNCLQLLMYSFASKLGVAMATLVSGKPCTFVPEEGDSKRTKKKQRWLFTLPQKQELEAAFKENMYPSKGRLTQLSESLAVPVPTLRVKHSLILGFVSIDLCCQYAFFTFFYWLKVHIIITFKIKNYFF